MKIDIKIGIAFLCSLVCALLVIFLRTTPQGSLWNGYRIVYTDISLDSSYTLASLAEEGCKNVISLENQRIPLFLPETSPEISLMNASLSDNNYLSKRSLYFFDKSKQYSLYYVLEKDASLAEKALEKISEQGYVVGIDDNTSYPIVLPILVLAFAFVLFVFSSTKKYLFACAALFPILLSLCAPFYPVASSVFLLLYALYLSLSLWKRKGALNILVKNILILLFFSVSIFVAFATSLRVAFLFCFTILGTLSLLYIADYFENIKDKRYAFKPILIRSAKSIKLFTKKSKNALVACVMGSFLLLCFSLFSSGNMNVHSKKIMLPSAHSSSIVDTLPSLNDYVSWCYETMTLPYKRLEDESKKTRHTGTIVFPRYESTSSGIVMTENTYSNDQSFFETMINQIDELSYPAIEKMIKSQGETIRAGYSFNSGQKPSLFHTILVLISIIVPVVVLLRSRFV